jgi:iron complex transport system ATP-binding protein
MRARMLELDGIGWSVGKATILDHVSFAPAPGALTAMLGPNGAGKSTLLRIAAGLLAPSCGTVRWDGRPLSHMTSTQQARVRAVLSQHGEPAFPLSAGEVVEMGRYPHFDRHPGRHDREAVGRALERVGMTAFRDRAFATLSAGERQLVQMARVLAQIDAGESPGPRLLFLDEPTSALDVRHQLELLSIARGLLGENVTVIAVLHDLNLAVEFADHVVLLERGRIVHSGSTATGLPAGLLERVYGVRAHRARDEDTGREYWRFGL